MNRRKARETLLGMIVAMSFQESAEPAEQYAMLCEDLDIEEDNYIKDCYFGIAANLQKLDEKIGAHSVGWNADRLSHVSLSIMRIAVYEMFYAEDVPAAAAINEAIELAKTYDHENAPAFINGILNAVAKSEGLLQ